MLISIGLAAFWVEDTAPFYWIYQKILFIIGGLIIPLDVYPEFLQKLSKWLPFNYILWGPARLFVRFDTALLKQVLLNQAIWIGITGALAHLIYRRGVRKVVVHGG
jgi:ABC-2 type transport system permease protein